MPAIAAAERRPLTCLRDVFRREKWYRQFVMISPRVHAAALVLSIVSTGGVAVHSQGQRTLQVSFTPSVMRPGDVVRVEIDGGGEDAPTATILDQRLSFERDERGQQWRAFIGIDLETEPGTYEMAIHEDGRAPTARSVRIVPRAFQVRRLKVAPQFVDPPPDTLERILLESKLLADIYARTSPRLWTGAFILPVDGKPSSNFGTRSFYNGEPRSPHAGVDFPGKTGTPIRAANRGTIALAAPLYFTGNTVVIDHGGRLISVFAHLSEYRVKTGEEVESGTVVGLVGQTGRVTGPHLHWSVRLNGARVDPLSLIAATAD